MGIKISSLPLASSVELDNVFPIVQDNITYKATLEQIVDLSDGHFVLDVATTGALTAAYNNGSSGVGATLVNSGALSALTIDGVSVVAGNTVLVKDQATTYQNGKYDVTIAGDGATAWVLTRSEDYDTAAQIQRGDMFTIAQGTTNAKTQWLETAAVTTIGTDAITFESNVAVDSNLVKTNNTLGLAAMTNGQLFIGSTGVDPVQAAPTGSNGVTVTTGAGSLALSLTSTYLRYATVAITAAEFNGMYAAPKLLVAAGGANTLIVLEQLQLLMTYVSANYADGGVAAVQYDSTALGAGVIASTTLSAATFQAAASTGFTFNAGVVPITFSTCVNKGLYLSNVTGAFTTGDSTFVAHIWYRVISTT